MSSSIATSERMCCKCENMDSVVQCWQLSMQVVMVCKVSCISSIEDLVVYCCFVDLVYVFEGLAFGFVA